jgi:hypothetical protein
MNSKQFYEVVKSMRDAQKKVQTYGLQTYKQEAKMYEKQIDDEIARVDLIIYEKQNPKLNFNNNEQNNSK